MKGIRMMKGSKPVKIQNNLSFILGMFFLLLVIVCIPVQADKGNTPPLSGVQLVDVRIVGNDDNDAGMYPSVQSSTFTVLGTPVSTPFSKKVTIPVPTRVS
jgi:hypothetical protein